jgi:hypothetical protein
MSLKTVTISSGLDQEKSGKLFMRQISALVALLPMAASVHVAYAQRISSMLIAQVRRTPNTVLLKHWPASPQNTDCSVWWQWAANPACWAETKPIAVPPAPTQAQLDGVASGQLTRDQLVQQLTNQQLAAQQAINASIVQPDTSLAGQAGNVVGQWATPRSLPAK